MVVVVLCLEANCVSHSRHNTVGWSYIVLCLEVDCVSYSRCNTVGQRVHSLTMSDLSSEHFYTYFNCVCACVIFIGCCATPN